MMETLQFEIEAKRLRPLLLRRAVRYVGNADEAEDVVQETLLKLWFMRDRLDRYRSVEALSFVIVHHLCLNLLRDRKEECDVTSLPLADDGTAEQHYMAQEEMQWLLHRVEELPDAQQAVLRMKHIEGMEVEEIAALTGSNAAAVRANLSRARRKIREQFTGKR